jgi:hypothetical protein
VAESVHGYLALSRRSHRRGEPQYFEIGGFEGLGFVVTI